MTKTLGPGMNVKLHLNKRRPVLNFGHCFLFDICDLYFVISIWSKLYYSRICPEPNTTNLVVVNSSSPMGPKACSLEVLIPISAPSPS